MPADARASKVHPPTMVGNGVDGEEGEGGGRRGGRCPPSRGEACQLSSLVADFRITQLVDRMVGVHAMIPKAILGR